MAETGRDALEWHIHQDIPERQCGFTLDCEGMDVIDADEFDDDEHWQWEGRKVHCLRETWNDHDQCIWHADESKEEVSDELLDRRTDGPERLDGAVLRNADLGDADSFAHCRLRGGRLYRG